MIAPGTPVIFTDKIGSSFAPGQKEPHDGQTGTATSNDDSVYLVTFSDGQSVWADPEELSAA